MEEPGEHAARELRRCRLGDNRGGARRAGIGHADLRHAGEHALLAERHGAHARHRRAVLQRPAELEHALHCRRVVPLLDGVRQHDAVVVLVADTAAAVDVPHRGAERADDAHGCWLWRLD